MPKVAISPKTAIAKAPTEVLINVEVDLNRLCFAATEGDDPHTVATWNLLNSFRAAVRAELRLRDHLKQAVADAERALEMRKAEVRA